MQQVSLEEFLSLARKPQYNETLKKKIMAMFIDGDRKIDRSLTPVELTMKMIPDQITELIKGTEIDVSQRNTFVLMTTLTV